MVGLIARILLVAAAAIAEWFVASGEPNFGVLQGAVAVLLLAFAVIVVGLWPWRRR